MAGPIKAEIWHGEFSGSRGHEQKKDRPCLIWKDLDHCGMAIKFFEEPSLAAARDCAQEHSMGSFEKYSQSRSGNSSASETSGTLADFAIVIPFTGSIDKDTLPHTYLVEPSLSNDLGKESIALIFQITSVDKKRLIRKLGVLDKKEFDAIGGVLKDMLDI
jgi:mRNA-degrading endonuclease toxin of MazEF toxin-antitoxin module